MGCCDFVENGELEIDTKKPIVLFVLGAPGTGKTTQCKKLEEKYGFGNISLAGIQMQLKKEGKTEDEASLFIVLKNSLKSISQPITLIDSFPRNQKELAKWNREISSFVNDKSFIYFHCPINVMKARLINANREIDSISNSIDDYNRQSPPVIEELEKSKRIISLDSQKEVERLFRALEVELEAISLITIK